MENKMAQPSPRCKICGATLCECKEIAAKVERQLMEQYLIDAFLYGYIDPFTLLEKWRALK